jgi:ribosomal protein S27AE
MIIWHGLYSFRRKLVAFRNDFCLRCGVPRLAYRHRTFDVIHILFVPLLPLGFWKRWYCGTCGRNPHAAGRTRLPYKIAAAVVLGAITVVLFLEPTGSHHVGAMWFIRGFYGIPFLLTCIWIARSKPDPHLAELLLAVQPSSTTSCPLCGVGLAPGQDAWRCPRCGMERLTLETV